MSRVTVVAIHKGSLRYTPGELVLQSPRSCAVRLGEPADTSWRQGMEISIVIHGDEPSAMLGLLRSLPSNDGIISVTPFEPLP
jgi:hypothetical protein